MSRPWRMSALLLLCLLGLECLGLPVLSFFLWPIALLAIRLSFGWFGFLTSRIGRIEFDGGQFAVALSSLALLTAGGHWFLRWLARSRTEPADSTASSNEIDRSRAWRPAQTIAVVSLIVLMFVAGVSAVGITHQIAWAMSDPEPMLQIVSGRELSRLFESKNNLKQLGLAFHNDESERGSFVSGVTATPDGRLLHGWMAQLLPYVDQAPLHRQIDFQKPWNHPDNESPLSQPVRVFMSRRLETSNRSGGTSPVAHYAANAWVISGDRRMKTRDITDGLSNTFLTGEIRENIRPWGYPVNWRDPTIGINTSPQGFGGPREKGTIFLLADGSVRTLADDTDPAVLRAYALPNDGEIPRESP